MKKRAFDIGGALDKYTDLQAQHPLATMGANLAGSLVSPAIGTGLELPNIAAAIHHHRPWEAMGRTASAGLNWVPGLGPWARMLAPTAAWWGGNYMQQRADAAAPQMTHAASYGDRHMQQTKQAFLPALLAAAGPAALSAAKALGTGAILSGGMQAAGNAMGGRPITENVGSSALTGGLMGGVSQGLSAGAGKLMGSAAPAAVPPIEPKTAQAISRRIGFGNIYKQARYVPFAEVTKMNPSIRRSHCMSALVKMASHPDVMQKIGINQDEFNAIAASENFGPTELAKMKDMIAQKKIESGNTAMGRIEGVGEHERKMPAGGRGAVGITGAEKDKMLAGTASGKLDQALAGDALGQAGVHGAIGGGLGGVAGAGLGAMSGHPIRGGMMGAGAGLGGTLGYHGGNLLSLLAKSKGYNAPHMTEALRGAGAGLGGLAGAGIGYGLSPDEKQSSYQPRLLLSSLTNAVRAGGQHVLPGSFPTYLR